MQGYLLDAMLPPIRQHNLPCNQNRLIDLKQSVTLTGLASQQFHAGVCGVGALYHVFKMYLGSCGDDLRTWAPGCDGGERSHLVLPIASSLLPRMLKVRRSMDWRTLLVHTMENCVKYWTHTLSRHDDIEYTCTTYDRYKPEFFNLSNMVEVQVGFQAIRVARHDYIFILKLRADDNIAAIEAIARAPVSPMKKVKRKVGYGSSDDDGEEDESLEGWSSSLSCVSRRTSRMPLTHTNRNPPERPASQP
ncbi:hypothetical protein C8Q80DRAFT_1338050 [Daedaleopsis nitida]|nr:hypothetical protein C8Q80DRAFT_1338050 [Daedaleopsis nitida]